MNSLKKKLKCLLTGKENGNHDKNKLTSNPVQYTLSFSSLYYAKLHTFESLTVVASAFIITVMLHIIHHFIYLFIYFFC